MIALIWLLAGCGDPLNNDPPEMVTFNGFAPQKTWQLPDLRIGENDIDIVIEDRDGDDWRLWFPWEPIGWEVDPFTGRGTWTVPADYSGGYHLRLLVEDDHASNPLISGYELWLSVEED